jgi:hypothetical protein
MWQLRGSSLEQSGCGNHDERRSTMSDAMADYRLADVRGRREWLESDARGAADEHARIRRHLDAVRTAERSAAAAAHGARDRFEDALEDFGTTLAIARHRLAADLTDDRRLFERAVDAELRDWDVYIDRRQRRAADEAGSAGEQSRLAIAELRSRHDDVARCLREMRHVPDETWRERRAEVDAALDELERAADGTTATTGRES